MLLLLTNSEDGTSTQLIRFSDTLPVFRFNVDLWRDYRIDVRPDAFRIVDPTGREVGTRTCSGVYYRKPHWFGSEEGTPAERWARAQVSAVLECLVNWGRRESRLILVDPLDERRLDKFHQLGVARQYFFVPDAALGWGVVPEVEGELIAKSLVAVGFEGGKFLFTRKVARQTLDPLWPWLLQQEQVGEDVTVVYVDGCTFAAALDRKSFEGEDWRRFISDRNPLPWHPFELDPQEHESICSFMKHMKLKFGRLDFIRAKDGRLAFLEVNTNGEWGWLDDGRRGILRAVWRYIETHAASR